MSLKDVASDCLILAGENTYNIAEAQNPGDGGNAMFMQEECDEEYDDVRMILTGESPYNEYQQKMIIKTFMDHNNITKEKILNYRKGRENESKIYRKYK